MCLASPQRRHLDLLLHDLLTWPILKHEKQMRVLGTNGGTAYLQLHRETNCGRDCPENLMQTILKGRYLISFSILTLLFNLWISRTLTGEAIDSLIVSMVKSWGTSLIIPVRRMRCKGIKTLRLRSASDLFSTNRFLLRKYSSRRRSCCDLIS